MTGKADCQLFVKGVLRRMSYVILNPADNVCSICNLRIGKNFRKESAFFHRMVVNHGNGGSADID